MTTKFIGVKEFRQNMAKIANRARKNNERLIVLRKNEPIFELRPIKKEDASLEKLMLNIQKGMDDIKHGRVVSEKEARKRLGIE